MHHDFALVRNKPFLELGGYTHFFAFHAGLTHFTALIISVGGRIAQFFFFRSLIPLYKTLVL